MFVAERRESLFSDTQVPKSSHLCGKSLHMAANVSSIVILIFSLCLAAFFKSGSLESIVAWGTGAASLCFTFVLRCKKTKKVIPEEIPDEIIQPNALTQKPPVLRKHKVVRELAPMKFEDLEKQYLRVQNPSGEKQEAPQSDINSRLHYHFLSAIMDSLFTFCDVRVLKGAGVHEKVIQLRHFLSLDHTAHLRFLVEENVCKNDLQQKLYFLFQTLTQVDNPSMTYTVLRHNVFQYLKSCRSSHFYRQNYVRFNSLSKEEAIKEFPDMSFLQMIAFEIMSQVSVNHFFHETVNNSNEKVIFADNFSAVMFTTSISNASHSVKSVFLHLGSTDVDSDVLLLFFDYCTRENLRCLFVPKAYSLSSEYAGSSSQACLSIDLSSENVFFNQEEGWTEKELNKSKNFIVNLRGALLKDFIQWVEKNNVPICENDLFDTIDFVHSYFFEKKRSLSPQERAIFVRIVYAHLIERLSLEAKADFIFFQGLKEREISILGTLLALSLIRKANENDALELKQVRLISRLPHLCHADSKVSPLLEQTIEHIFSLSKKQKGEIRKKGIRAQGQHFTCFDTLIEDNPSQTQRKLPSEASTIVQYHEWIAKEIDEKRSHTFILYYFVQNFFNVPNKEEYISDLLNQFREKDFFRQQYLIENQKIRLIDFRKKLQKGWNDEEIKKEFPKAVPFQLISSIATLEEETLDPVNFCSQLEVMLKETPKFLEFVKKCYFNQREYALRQYTLRWFKQNQERSNESLCLGQQGVLQEITCFFQLIYNFSPRGPKIKQDSNNLEDFIQIFQRSPEKSANTCFNFTLVDKHPTIEVTQFYEASQLSKKNPLYYTIGYGSIDLISGHQTVRCSYPQKENPGDISEFVMRNKKINNNVR